RHHRRVPSLSGAADRRRRLSALSQRPSRLCAHPRQVGEEETEDRIQDLMAHPGKTWSDEQVRAFVEGTLDPQSAASLSAEVHQDLALAQRVANLRAQRRRDIATQGTAGPAASAG